MGSTALSSVRPVSPHQQKLAATGSVFAFVSAIAWILLGVDSIIRPYQVNARDTYWMIPASLMAITFIYVHLVHESRQPKLEVIGFWAVMFATALVFAGSIGLQLNIQSLAFLGFPGGAIVWIVGMFVFGLGLLKADVLPKYVGWAIILFEPGSMLAGMALSPIAPLLDRGAYSAGVEKGLAIAIVAWGLRKFVKSGN
jgi:hypothetical protein